jgi:hypothetical protein
MPTPTDLLSQYLVDYAAVKKTRDIGFGAQAIVYEATLNGQRVAVKKFHPHAARNLDVTLIAKLSHRNVTRLL